MRYIWLNCLIFMLYIYIYNKLCVKGSAVFQNSPSNNAAAKLVSSGLWFPLNAEDEPITAELAPEVDDKAVADAVEDDDPVPPEAVEYPVLLVPILLVTLAPIAENERKL